MGLLGKLFGTSDVVKSDPHADEIANRFVEAFQDKEVNTEKLNSMSEDLVSLSKMYWKKGDYESYKKLLSAAEQTSYLYQGDNYPHDLVEDLIRNSHE